MVRFSASVATLLLVWHIQQNSSSHSETIFFAIRMTSVNSSMSLIFVGCRSVIISPILVCRWHIMPLNGQTKLTIVAYFFRTLDWMCVFYSIVLCLSHKINIIYEFQVVLRKYICLVPQTQHHSVDISWTIFAESMQVCIYLFLVCDLFFCEVPLK